MMKILATVILLLLSLWGFSQTFWKIRTESGEEILLTIEVNSSAKTFKAYTRKDAIKEIAGFFAYNLAHAAGKLKYPEIVYIEGKADQQKDSLRLNGMFYYTDKKYAFQSSISGNKFIGKYTDNRNRLHKLTGEKLVSNKPIRNYQSIIAAAISLAEKNLPRQDWIKSSEWNDFKKSVNELKSKISDDYELGAVIMWYAKKLSFSPFEIEKMNSRSIFEKPRSKPRLVVVKPGIGLIDGNFAPFSRKEMDSIAAVIIRSKITGLVLDLRGRSRLSVANIQVLLNYLSEKEFNAGVFLTQKWWNMHTAVPRLNEYKSLLCENPELAKEVRFSREMGYLLKITPSKSVFSGKVYVLIDSRTNKASEVLACILKREKTARLIGQKTVGFTPVTESLHLSEEYNLQIPVAEFYDADGKTVTGSGVEPDVSCNPQQAIDYILKEF
jgi:hypothetical protein